MRYFMQTKRGAACPIQSTTLFFLKSLRKVPLITLTMSEKCGKLYTLPVRWLLMDRGTVKSLYNQIQLISNSTNIIVIIFTLPTFTTVKSFYQLHHCKAYDLNVVVGWVHSKMAHSSYDRVVTLVRAVVCNHFYPWAAFVDFQNESPLP